MEGKESSWEPADPGQRRRRRGSSGGSRGDEESMGGAGHIIGERGGGDAANEGGAGAGRAGGEAGAGEERGTEEDEREKKRVPFLLEEKHSVRERRPGGPRAQEAFQRDEVLADPS